MATIRRRVTVRVTRRITVTRRPIVTRTYTTFARSVPGPLAIEEEPDDTAEPDSES